MWIAILDDDPADSAAVREALAGQPYDLHIYSKKAELAAALRKTTFDLLILDWTLPEGSGLDIVVSVKRTMANPPPILMVTARVDESDVVKALELGVDDYIVKPVSAPLLLARVRALLRRAFPPAPNGVEVYGSYSLNLTNGEVSLAGQPLPALTPKEFALCLLLFRNSNRALSRDYIASSVWGWNVELSSRTMDSHVSKLRSKMQLRPQNGVRLTPVYGFGYRFETLSMSEGT
jgi:DNA-binding response OmpR family regulator